MSSDSMQQRVPIAVSPPRYSVSHQMVTTAFEQGCRQSSAATLPSGLQGVTEVLAYGTAVIVEPANPGESYRS